MEQEIESGLRVRVQVGQRAGEGEGIRGGLAGEEVCEERRAGR